MAANDNSLVFDYVQKNPQNRQPGVQYATGATSPYVPGVTGANPNPNGATSDPFNDTSNNGLGTATPPTYPNPNPNGATKAPAYQIPTTDVGYDPNYQPTPTGMTSKSGGMPQGIDPTLASIYQQAGVTPGDRGTGFVDWQYWQGVGPSQYDRLRRDLAGTGTDQPTGTPGSGPWQNSGRGAPGSGPGPGGAVRGPIADQPGGGGSGYSPFSAGQSFDVNDAIKQLNQINHTLGGSDLTDAQIQEAAGLVGYQQGQPVTGAQLNQIAQEMYRRAGKTPPGSGGPGGGQRIDPGGPGNNFGGPAGDLYAELMRRAHEGLDVDPNSPVIKNQTDAFRANETRMGRNAISAEAERGGPNANITAYGRSQNEKIGQDVSDFEGKAMQHEVDMRRHEIEQALQLGTNLLTEEQRQALQLELEQLSIQSNQFMQLRDLQERGFEFGVNRADYVGLGS